MDCQLAASQHLLDLEDHSVVDKRMGCLSNHIIEFLNSFERRVHQEGQTSDDEGVK